MCGIYGSTLAYNKKQIEEKLLRTQFRGPDSLGIHQFETQKKKISFAHYLVLIEWSPSAIMDPVNCNSESHPI